MRKIIDSKFLFILALSVLVLIILGIGAFYLFDDSDDVFVKDGYILNPLSAKNERFLFDKDTTYKSNLSGMVVFNDTDNNEVSVFKDSFLHYMDSSISFLKNGAILDLDSINGSEAVKFYNITNKSIVTKSNDGYVIETNNNDIKINNFMGRISDNKYIVAGSLEAKIPGNEKNITGNYFEIVYNDEGIITIENNNVKYQVAAQGSYIYAGETVIDLGNKKIQKNGEDVMSITAITINGNENIEIIPKETEEDKNDDDGDNNNPGNNDGNGNGNEGQNTPGNSGTGSDNDTKDDIQIDDLVVSLGDYKIHSTYIVTQFKVMNQREDDSLKLRVTDLSTGKTIDRKYNITDGASFEISPLTPDTDYLFTVVNERDDNRYFQKILTTKEFGVDLKVTYVTANEIGCKVMVEDNSEILNADLTLMKFDENNSTHEEIKTYKLSELPKNDDGEYEGITFTNLDSNTIYTLVMNRFVDGIENTATYYIEKTILTLKEAPSFGAMEKEVLDDRFKLYLEDVIDNDNAIEKYTYYIFDNEGNSDSSTVTFDPKKAITEVSKKSAEAVEILIDGNKILSNHKYLYMVSIEYFDNEKYVDYVIDGRIDLFIADEPLVTIKEIETGYDRIGATVTINDISCQIAVKGRTCYDEESTLVIDVKERTGSNTEMGIVPGYPRRIDSSEIEVTGNTLTLKDNLTVTGLKPGTFYIISVSAAQKEKLDLGIKPLSFGAGNKNEIMTLMMASFNGEWLPGTSNYEHAIHGTFQLIERPNQYAIGAEEAAGLIQKLVFKLYDGPKGNLINQTLLATSEVYTSDVKENFFDKEFEITEKIFDIADYVQLRELTKQKTGRDDGKLSPFYTVTVSAYYANDVPVSITPEVEHFAIAEYLRSDITAPTLTAVEIPKEEGDGFSKWLTAGDDGGTAVGYTLHVHIARSEYESANATLKRSRILVYDENGTPVKFYIDNKGTEALDIPTNLETLVGEDYDVNIYMANGVPNGTSDDQIKYMTRGKKYRIVAEITSEMNNTSEVQLSNVEEVIARKEKPSIKKQYVYQTTKTGQITYKYSIIDIDNAWHDGKLNYSINDSEEVRQVDIVRNTIEEYTGEESTFTLDRLHNHDTYTLKYGYDMYDSGNGTEDTINVIIGKENRLFDGYYDATSEGNNKYNFRFEVIDRAADTEVELPANKVTIKVLATEEMLNRILTYKVHLSDNKGNAYDEEVTSLNKCNDGSEEYRCFSLEYKRFKQMKSLLGESRNDITVSINAVYDNGLMGYGYPDRVVDGITYPYMIMELESSKDGSLKYFVLNNSSCQRPGYQFVSGAGERIYPLAYGYYEFNKGKINYYSQYNVNDTACIAYSLGSGGYWVTPASGWITPKLVSVDPMDSNKNTFYFSSITPTVRRNKTISLIDGARIILTLKGTDTDANDYCADSEGTECVKNGVKKLYIDVWDKDGNIAGPRVTKDLTSQIDGQYTIDIDGLLYGSDYTYKVYAYLNDSGNKKLTQILDDDEGAAITYDFSSKKLLGKDGVLANATVSYDRPADGAYNEKELITKISLNDYDTETNIPYNFTVSYDFCKESDCANQNKLFSKDLGIATKNMEGKENITSHETEYGADYFEYGKDYYMNIYMSYGHYEKNANGIWEKVPRTYRVYDEATNVPIGALNKPSFVVDRSSGYDEESGKAFIDIRLSNLRDKDAVLTDGYFYVRVTKVGQDQAEGMLFLDEDGDGIYTQASALGDYVSRGFSADDRYEGNYISDGDSRIIRIGNLEPDTIYTVSVFGNAHINNSGTDEKDIVIKSGKDDAGYQIWTPNIYGIAMGKSINYYALLNGFVINYPAASNLPTVNNTVRNIRRITVDVKEGIVSDNENGDSGEVAVPYFYHEYVIGENDKYFVAEVNEKYAKETPDYYKFYIRYDDDENYRGLTNNERTTYTVTTWYYVWDEKNNQEIRIGENLNKAVQRVITYDPSILDEFAS